MKLAILLTATVKVQAVGGNFTVDERAEMYSSTLSYYTSVIGKRYPIVFLENSDFDLNIFKRKFENALDIEFIQFKPDSLPFDQSKGKSYNEYLMIKHGILQSKKLKECTHFLKITGRYAMLNIKCMIKEIERRAEDKVFMGDIKDTCFYEKIGSDNFGHWGDSRYWVFAVDYYKENMLDCYLEMDDSVWGKWAEDYLLKIAREAKNDKRFIFRFRTQVRFNGITGMLTSKDLASGKYRQDSPSMKIKWMMRQFLRWILPNVWF